MTVQEETGFPMSIALKTGDLVAGRYQVEEVLGKGGMGVVVAARDQQLDRCVALKVLSQEHVRNREATARFLQEARASVRLTSDHVVKIYDIGTLPDDVPYMVMEILRGADLAAVLESEGTLAVSDAVGFVVQACEAVGEAHLRGIVHRDLKPANLFLSRQVDGTSRIKVLDFGISKLTLPSDTPAASLTHTSWMLGSPVYMSPEQLRSARDVDCRADIWALGTILFELIVGKPPFLADSVPELSAKILIDPVPIPSERKGSPLPDGLDEVILKALEKNLQMRFQNIAEFTLALAQFAPKRCIPNVERIARMHGPQDRATALGGDIPPSTTPQIDSTVLPGTAEIASENISGTRTSWEHSTPEGTRRASYRRLGATMGGAIAIGALLGIVLASPSDPDIELDIAHRPKRGAIIAQDIPVLPVSAPPVAVLDQSPNPAYTMGTPDAGVPDAGEPMTEKPRKAHYRGRATPGTGVFHKRAPLRKDFGGRK